MLEFKYIFGENGYELAKDMRERIFGEELGMTKLCDDKEADSYHFIGYDKTLQIGVSRLTQIDERNFSIAYVAIEKGYRRQFVGDLVMRALADKTVTLGGSSIMVESPVTEKGFFEYEGYEAVGEEYISDGRSYIKMVKDLTKVEKSCRGCAK